MVENRTHKLKVTVDTAQAKFVELTGPRDGRMVPLVKETIQGVVGLQLMDKETGRVILTDNGVCGGLEYGGDQMLLAGSSGNMQPLRFSR